MHLISTFEWVLIPGKLESNKELVAISKMIVVTCRMTRPWCLSCSMQQDPSSGWMKKKASEVGYCMWFSFSSDAFRIRTGDRREIMLLVSLLFAAADSLALDEFLSPNGGLLSTGNDSIARGSLRGGTSSLCL